MRKPTLQVQYTTEGSIWHNANITSAGTAGVLATNTITTNSLVVGTYIILTNNGTAAWDNQVTVNLTGISGVDNNPNFALRIVNASTGTNCIDTTGAPYINNTGTWTLDNVVIQGVSYDTVADWTFDNIAALPKQINNPHSGNLQQYGDRSMHWFRHTSQPFDFHDFWVWGY